MAAWLGGVLMGGVLITGGVATLRGWQPDSAKRPRLTGWASVIGGLGFLASAAMLRFSDPSTGLLSWWSAAIGLPLGLSLVLLVASRPRTRLDSRLRFKRR
ncbi:hypothetical protein ACFYNO_01900 [Kitasatospora sp. NPDC006697]|uniref:hypothetical protein n=1 Tax=Kitasatospora sp. NPDC006697 TaxID=3364020 RepID=UPI0036AF6F11